jgi:hypothetical protein
MNAAATRGLPYNEVASCLDTLSGVIDNLEAAYATGD